MDKTARIRKFKVAFIKPKSPNSQVDTLRTQMEKAVKSGKKDTTEASRRVIQKNAVDLRNAKQQDYLDELLAYKLTKHWNDSHEFEMWVTNCGDPQDRVRALRKVFKKPADPKMVVECWGKCEDSREITSLCYELAPDAMRNACIDKCIKDGGVTINNPKLSSEVTAAVFKKLGPAKFPMNQAGELDANEAIELAETDPQTFYDTFVKDGKPVNRIKLLRSPEVRAALKKNDKLWTEIKKSNPMLAFLEKIDAKLKNVSKEDRNKKAAAEVFNELISDTGTFEMTYYTNSLAAPRDVMAQPKSETIKGIDLQKQKLQALRKPGDDTDEKLAAVPDVMATQCDELVTLLTMMADAALGPNSGVETKHIVLPGMVLTIPLDGQPGVPGGLLKRTFKGNVYDDTNQLNGQVMFTGDTSGSGDPRAHSVLEIDGVKYDAVLGTRGDDVDKAVAEQFEGWDKTSWRLKTDTSVPIWCARSKSGDNWMIAEPGLKPGANKNGFISAYRITNNPSKYVVFAEDIEDEAGSEGETEEK